MVVYGIKLAMCIMYIGKAEKREQRIYDCTAPGVNNKRVTSVRKRGRFRTRQRFRGFEIYRFRSTTL